MDQLIPLVNELQWIFKATGAEEIQLPQIVVVGSQGSGKSSVLESLVGQMFLPGGPGIVTRCPIIVQLVKEECEGDEATWRFTFDHEPEVEYTDAGKVRQVLERRMDELTENKDKGITAKPIILQIRSPSVIPLTVIDLPGIVKLRLGDQPADIEEQVRKLIMEYIDNPRALILAVSPANADIATSESIKLAKEVDPKEERTIAVITKLDLMDKGTDATRLLSGDIVKVKYIVGVMNRSQQDINDNVSAESAVQKEDAFLKKNYPSFKNKIGSAFLAEKLNQLLVEHIQTCLPDLAKDVQKLMQKHQATLFQLGPVVEECEKQNVMDECIITFFQNFHRSTTEGKLAIDISRDADKWSTRIRKHNNNVNGKIDAEIVQALDRCTNIEGFASIEEAFKSVAKNKIKELVPLAIEEAQAVYEHLRTSVDLSLRGGKWLKLNALISSTAKKILAQHLIQAQTMIKEYFEVQRCMIYSLDPKFRDITKEFEKQLIAHSSAYAAADEQDNDDLTEDDPEDPNNNLVHPTSHQNAEKMRTTISRQKGHQVAVMPLTTREGTREIKPRSVDYCRRLVFEYCRIVQKEVGDFLPKQCIYFLYEKSVGFTKTEINKQVSGKHAVLISELENVAQKRKHAEEMLSKLQNAQDVIDRLHYSVDLSDLLNLPEIQNRLK